MISNLAKAQNHAELTVATALRPLGVSTRARRNELVVIPAVHQGTAILGDTCVGSFTTNDHVSSFSAKWFAGYPTMAKKDHSQRERPT